MIHGGRYEVTGRLAFRGYEPGETFTAVLEPAVEARAIRRGNIRLLERITPSIQPGSYRLPRNWSTSEREVCKT